MKKIAYIISKGWRVSFFEYEGIYADASKDGSRRIGYSEQSLLKALDNLFEILTKDKLL